MNSDITLRLHDNIQQDSALSLLEDYFCVLQYDAHDYPGAGQKAYVHKLMLPHLNKAKTYLESISTTDKKYNLVIWDAYRTKETQQDIYDRYVSEIAKEQGISTEDAYPLGLKFVNDPKGTFPHGTGGTVDVTLAVNNVVADMGTGFDEFSEKSQKNWFRAHAPQSPEEQEVHSNREVLREAMEHAGFVGLDSEWWHYEWGTALWAAMTDQEPLLNHTIIDHKPTHNSPAYRSETSPRLPVLYSGVAQLFNTSEDRAAALSGASADHYYSRKNHPTLQGLSDLLTKSIINSSYCSLVASGFNAAKVTILSLMSTETLLVFDRRSYYEIGNEVGLLAKELGWNVEYVDFTDISAVKQLLSTVSPDTLTTLYFDTPMNWWLDTVDLKAIHKLKNEHNLAIAADITLDPTQRDILKYIDIAVMSLSKYASAGFTLGGAIFTNNPRMYAGIEAEIGRMGSRMTVDTAMSVWSQAVTLNDRFSALSAKSTLIADTLKKHPLVNRILTVHTPQPQHVGGVIVIEFKSASCASIFEKVIAQNIGNKFKSVNLAYTFGGVMTTIEHFASNPRPSKLNSALLPVPDNLVRIGIGYEPYKDILSDISIALDFVDSAKDSL